jgi:aspartyl-tRNA(Asn)/glutamyl-tRNA(Gln) amidotransferase subunit C
MISQEIVEHVAQLARVEIDESEKEKYAHDLNEIIDYVAELESAPTENIASISQISGLSNIARTDEVTPSLPNEKVLQNAPDKQDGFIKVKKVFE